VFACRLIITSLLISIKFHDDRFYTNEYYSKIAGITNKELNILEVEFIKLLDFSLCTGIAQYSKYMNEICKNCALPPPSPTTPMKKQEEAAQKL
jgi:hypothetical protein